MDTQLFVGFETLTGSWIEPPSLASSGAGRLWAGTIIDPRESDPILKGVVVNPRGEAVASAHVDLFGHPRVTTDESGSFAIPVQQPELAFGLEISKESFATRRLPVLLDEQLSSPLRITLDEARPLTLIIQHGGRVPVLAGDISLYCQQGSDLRRVLNKSVSPLPGTIRILDAEPGDLELLIEHRGVSYPVSIASGETEAEVVLEAPATVTLVWVDWEPKDRAASSVELLRTGQVNGAPASEPLLAANRPLSPTELGESKAHFACALGNYRALIVDAAGRAHVTQDFVLAAGETKSVQVP